MLRVGQRDDRRRRANHFTPLEVDVEDAATDRRAQLVSQQARVVHLERRRSSLGARVCHGHVFVTGALAQQLEVVVERVTLRAGARKLAF